MENRSRNRPRADSPAARSTFADARLYSNPRPAKTVYLPAVSRASTVPSPTKALGHVAGAYLPADVYVRFRRQPVEVGPGRHLSADTSSPSTNAAAAAGSATAG